MTWTLKAKGTNNNGTSGDVRPTLTLTLDASIAIGDTVCVAATYSDGPTGAAITDSLGNTYTQVTNTDDTSNGQRLSTFCCLVTNAGTPTLTLRFTPTPGTTTADFMSFNAEGFSGSDATSTVDGTGAAQVQSAPTTSTDATTSGTFSTATDGDLIYTATLESATGNNPGAVGTGFTALQTSGGVILKTAFKTQSTHGSVAGTWTAAANAAHITAALAATPTPSGGGATVLPGVGVLTATGFAPTFVSSANKVVLAGLGALVVAGFAPTFTATQNRVVQPGVGVAVVTGFAPVINPAAVRHFYTTDFGATEDPISESNNWINGQTDGTQWGDIHTASGKATGKRARDFGDNTALLKGLWPDDQYAEAVVFKGTVDESFFPEVELRLRSAISANVNTGYEIGWSCRAGSGAYFFVARWTGPYDDYTYITNQNSSSHQIANGDLVRAEIRGSALVVYRNGVQVFSIADVTKDDGGNPVGALYSSGAPGIGTNCNTGGGAFLDGYGFESFNAGDVGMVVVQPGVGVATVTGFAPTFAATQNKVAQAGVGLAVVTGFAPTPAATQNRLVAAGVGSAVVAGFAPTVTATSNQSVTAGVGVLAATGQAPSITISASRVALPQTGVLVFTAFAPTIAATASVTITTETGQLFATGFAPNVPVSAPPRPPETKYMLVGRPGHRFIRRSR